MVWVVCTGLLKSQDTVLIDIRCTYDPPHPAGLLPPLCSPSVMYTPQGDAQRRSSGAPAMSDCSHMCPEHAQQDMTGAYLMQSQIRGTSQSSHSPTSFGRTGCMLNTLQSSHNYRQSGSKGLGVAVPDNDGLLDDWDRYPHIWMKDTARIWLYMRLSVPITLLFEFTHYLETPDVNCAGQDKGKGNSNSLDLSNIVSPVG